MAIVGGGLTGLRAALHCADADLSVIVLSKVHPLRSHSVAAQGGVNASLNNNRNAGEDSWQAHAFDTVKGSDYLADQDAVDILCSEAPRAVLEMEHMGTAFSRDEEGRIAQRPFGGAGFPRTCYAADRTGHNMLHTLYEQTISRNVQFLEDHFVTALDAGEDGCTGLTAYDLVSGNVIGVSAKAVLLATGGYGRIFTHSTNAHVNTGEGAYLAMQAGVALKDMEFVQFHPTTLYGTNILISEAARGEGGHLLNRHGERFMSMYAAKAMELAPRDIVARAIQSEIDAGNGFDGYVQLDLRHLGKQTIMDKLPGIRQIAIDFAGVDPIEQPVPVQPGQHYSMGGIETANDGSTTVPGLYAAGEAACVSVHGANRLGGNSLLETLVFGRLAGMAMAKRAKGTKGPGTSRLIKLMRQESERIAAFSRPRKGGEKVIRMRNQLRREMNDSFGIYRNREEMEQGLDVIRGRRRRADELYIEDTGKRYNQAVIEMLELQAMLPLADSIAISAIAREESRGSHFRTDFPKRDDKNYLRHTIVKQGQGSLELSYAPVRLGRYEVKERSY